MRTSCSEVSSAVGNLKAFAPCFLLAGMLLLIQSAAAQVDLTSAPPAVEPADLVQQVGPPGAGVYAITEAGPHHRRWAKVSNVQMPDG